MNTKRKYNVSCIADHGKDGFIVVTSEEIHTMKYRGEFTLLREVFKGEKTIGEIYTCYLQIAQKIYGQPSYSGHIVDLVKDKPFYKLLMELAANLPNGFAEKAKYIPYEETTYTLSNYLQRVDTADNDEEFHNKLNELLEKATYNSHLKLFYLGLGDKAAQALSELMYRSQSQNEIEFFKNRPKIKSVNLTNNFLSYQNCLSHGISACKSLEELILRENPIGDLGLRCMIESLSEHPNLKELDLIDCNLTDDAMNQIGTLLATSKTIETIRLSCNDITDEGIEPVLDLIKSNSSIKTIDLFNTKVSEEMRNKVNDALLNKEAKASFNP